MTSATRLLACLGLLWATSAAAQLQVDWATACHSPLQTPFFIEKEYGLILLEDSCFTISGERSGYDGGFNPVADKDRLLLFVTGQRFQPGSYQAHVQTRQHQPRCLDCCAYCATHAGTRLRNEVLTVELEQPAEFLLFDLETRTLFPDWRLQGVEIEVTVAGTAMPAVDAALSLPPWPWCH